MQTASQRLKIAAVVLAAGASTRFGPENKLLADFVGRPVVTHVIASLTEVAPAQIIVVTSAEDASVACAVAHLPVTVVANPAPERGMGSSISCGVSAVPADVDGILIVPGDMPTISAELLLALIALFATGQAKRIVYPVTTDGEQRNPVLWPAKFRAQLSALDGLQGGKQLLSRSDDEVTVLKWAEGTQLADIDTHRDLEALRAHASAGASDPVAPDCQ